MIENLERIIESIADEAFNLVSNAFDTLNQQRPTGEFRTWIPRSQKALSEDEVIFVLELAGVATDDISVDIMPGLPMVLEVSGARTPVLDADTFTALSQAAFTDGSFLFQHALPKRVVPEKTSAKMTDGRLVIRIPREKRIRVNVGRE